MDADEIEQLAERFFAAVAGGDIDTVAELYAPDAVVWHNFDQRDQPRDENLAVLAWLDRRMPGRRYEDVRRILLPDGFVQQHVLRGRTTDGIDVEMPAMLRVICAGGQIQRLEEYLDTAQAAPLRRPAGAA